MSSLKERLQARPDLSSQTVPLLTAGGEPVTIRRITVAERNVLMARMKADAPDHDTRFGQAIVAISVVPPMTEDEVGELPAGIVDEIAMKVMDFNGWTERSRKELADQFRAPAGPPV